MRTPESLSFHYSFGVAWLAVAGAPSPPKDATTAHGNELRLQAHGSRWAAPTAVQRDSGLGLARCTAFGVAGHRCWRCGAR